MRIEFSLNRTLFLRLSKMLEHGRLLSLMTKCLPYHGLWSLILILNLLILTLGPHILMQLGTLQQETVELAGSFETLTIPSQKAPPLTGVTFLQPS